MEREKGSNKVVDRFLRFISDDDKAAIDYYFYNVLNKEYKSINDEDEIPKLLIADAVSYEEQACLLNYSGFNYRHINAVLRGTWNYDENGSINYINNYRVDGEKLKKIIMEHPTVLTDDLMLYRGVPLNYFSQYGIESIEDLKYLEGKYMLDLGFVSTSVQDDKCFFNRENELGLNYNVKIEYMVPKEFRDGMFLDGTSSYAPSQQEFVINAANLARVSTVKVQKDNTAVVRAVIIPKELYDPYFKAKQNNK